MTTSANLNAFHVKMWVDVIEHLGFAPHLRVNIDKARAGIETGIPRNKLIPGTSLIVLNISAGACGYRNFDFDGGHMLFSMRFNGRSHDITLPVECVEHVFANANNTQLASPYLSQELLTFSNVDGMIAMRIDATSGSEEGELEDDEDEYEDDFGIPDIVTVETGTSVVDNNDVTHSTTERTVPAPRPPRGKPTLSIVK